MSRDARLRNLVVELLDAAATDLNGDSDVEALSLLLSCVPADQIRAELFEKVVAKHIALVQDAKTGDDAAAQRFFDQIHTDTTDTIARDTVARLRTNWPRLSSGLKRRVWATLVAGHRLLARC